MTQTLPADADRTAAPADRQQPAPAPASGRERDHFFDNAKLVAIVLVLVGHSWEPLLPDSRVLTAAYLLVYNVHMPAFILISGYFSRSFDARPDRVRRLITGIAVPYAVFETAYTLFVRYADNQPSMPISLVDPWWLTWFLAALFVWRLTAPLWRVVRRPLPVSLCIAALATTSQIGEDLDLQRVLQYLPFFVAGLCLRPEHFRYLRLTAVRAAALPVFAVSLAFAYWAAPRMNVDWVYRRESAHSLGVSAWTGMAMTLGMFACSAVLTFFFLSLIPRRRMWISSLGAGTMYAFLLHGFVPKGAVYWGWYDHHFLHTPAGAVLVSAAAVALALALCTRPVRTVFRPLVEPELAWAFRNESLGRPDSPSRNGSTAGARRGQHARHGRR